MYNGRLCIPNKKELKDEILKEAHGTKYTIYPGSTKMYQNLKEVYWWKKMEQEVAAYVAACNICQ